MSSAALAEVELTGHGQPANADAAREPTGTRETPELASAVNARTERAGASRTLWGIDWREHLPRQVTASGIVATHSDYDRGARFVRDNYAAIFRDSEDSPFKNDVLTPAKERFYRRFADFFEFVHEGRTVGLLICTVSDWSSYYIRSAAALPAYQGTKMIQRLFPVLFEQLARAGVERVEADTSPSNTAVQLLLTRLRFNPSGSLLSERWGALVHYTRFLDEEAETVFLDQYCSGIRYQRRRGSQTRNPNNR